MLRPIILSMQVETDLRLGELIGIQRFRLRALGLTATAEHLTSRPNILRHFDSGMRNVRLGSRVGEKDIGYADQGFPDQTYH